MIASTVWDYGWFPPSYTFCMSYKHMYCFFYNQGWREPGLKRQFWTQFFFLRLIYLFSRESEQESEHMSRERGRERGVPQRSWSELKPRVECSTSWATPVPQTLLSVTWQRANFDIWCKNYIAIAKTVAWKNRMA